MARVSRVWLLSAFAFTSCDYPKTVTNNQTSNISQTKPAQEPSSPADFLSGQALTAAELLEPLRSINKDDYETTVAYEERLRTLDAKFDKLGQVRTVVPAEGFRWAFDADQKKISYNFKASGSLEALNLVVLEGIDLPQLWKLEDPQYPSGTPKLLLATKDCPVIFELNSSEAKRFRFSQNVHLVPYYTMSRYSVSVLSPMNKAINIAWKNGVWNEVFIAVDLIKVTVLGPDGQIITTIKC